MATVKGQNLRIFAGGRAIAAALECQLQVQMQVQQLSTKDDEGSWTQNTVASLQWSMQSQQAVTDDPERNDAASLSQRIGQAVRVEMAMASGEKNSDKGETIIAGEAIISDVQITAENRRRGTCTVQLTGIRNLLNEISRLKSADGHHLLTADGNRLAAPHEH